MLVGGENRKLLEEAFDWRNDVSGICKNLQVEVAVDVAESVDGRSCTFLEEAVKDAYLCQNLQVEAVVQVAGTGLKQVCLEGLAGGSGI